MEKASEYCYRVFDGTHDTPKPTASGKLLLTSKNILNNSLDKKDAYYISEKDYEEINKRSKVNQWDILFSMIGTVGNVCLLMEEPDFAIKNMGVFSCRDEDKAKWLFYYLQSPLAKKYVRNYLNGAVQKFLPLNFLQSFPVLSFDEKKKKISQFLWLLDSKVNINKKISITLESIAKTLYDYWFVQFDFPDAQGRPYKSSGGKMVYSEELGREIPEGWKNGIIADLGSVVAGGTPNTSHVEYYAEVGYAWITPKDMSELNGKYVFHGANDISDAGLRDSSAKLMPAGSVLYTTRAPIGYVAVAGNEVCTNQGFKSVVPNQTYGTEFTYYTLLKQTKKFKTVGNGSTFKEVSKDTFANVPIVLPPSKYVSQFNSQVSKISKRQMLAQKENEALIQLRDFLLPMLMNGQVTFKDEV